ncbi:MAG: hypothetical protein WC663_06110 [Patescibacteria group bacterium]|jgi:diacylglycerol kinase family enzyme
MYYFICESNKIKDKQAKLLDIISLKFSDLGIRYEKVSVTPLRTADILAHDAILDGRYTTIVAVGSDKTASQIINTIAKLKKANPQVKNWPVFGMVPLRESKIADVLGLPYDNAICEALTSRKVETIDLGRADGSYFMTSFDADFMDRKKTVWEKLTTVIKAISRNKLPEISFDVDKRIFAKAKLSSMSVINSLGNINFEGKNKIKLSKVNPKDQILDLIMFSGNKKQKESDLSFFRGKKIKFYCKEKLIMACDGQQIKKVPEVFEIVPKTIEVIVGKKRSF